jgi:hypothetical protein
VSGLQCDADQLYPLRVVANVRSTPRCRPSFRCPRECYLLPQDAFFTPAEALQIVRAGLEILGSEGSEAESKVELRKKLHNDKIATEADLVRAPIGEDLEPLIDGDRGGIGTIGPPVRGAVPPDLWRSGKVLFRRGAVLYETETEVFVYRSVRLCRADIERLWPPAPASTPDGQGTEPVSQGSHALRLAEDGEIVEAARTAHTHEEAAGRKPPNLNELTDIVSRLLRDRGCRATRRSIQRIGHFEEFDRLRLRPGQRWRPTRQN